MWSEKWMNKLIFFFCNQYIIVVTILGMKMVIHIGRGTEAFKKWTWKWFNINIYWVDSPNPMLMLERQIPGLLYIISCPLSAVSINKNTEENKKDGFMCINKALSLKCVGEWHHGLDGSWHAWAITSHVSVIFLQFSWSIQKNMG